MSEPVRNVESRQQSDAKKKLQEMLETFESQGMPETKNLRKAIAEDESLRNNILNAIEKGKLETFSLEVTQHLTKNEYQLESKTLVVSQNSLKAADGGNPSDLRELANTVNQQAAKALLTPEQRLDGILDAFESGQKPIKGKPDERLRNLIDESPLLKAQMLKAADNGDLGGLIAASKIKDNAGGSYHRSDRTITIKSDLLEKSGSEKDAKAQLIFDLGHETTHARNRGNLNRYRDEFDQEVARIIKSGDKHDFTAAMDKYLDQHKRSEAEAHLGGFNAIASMVRENKPNATLGDVYDAMPEGRRDDFFASRTKLKDGLKHDSNLMLPANNANITAMETYYYGKSKDDARLGPKGNLDYNHFYALELITEIYSQEAKAANPNASVRINMKKLELDEKSIEDNISFPDNKPRPYVKIEDGKKDEPTNFDPRIKVDLPKQPKPVAKSKNGGPSDGMDEPDGTLLEPRELVSGKMPGRGLSDATGMGLFDAALRLIEKDADKFGIKDEEQRRNLAGAVAESAAHSGMKSIDQIALGTDGKNLIPIEGRDPFAPWVNRSAVDIQQGKQQNLEQSFASIERHQQQQTMLDAQVSMSKEEPGMSRGARTL
ncbi:MAG: hypothetical protein E6Q88_06080 [Lysobacteraceae bacterium]|nr:MAG: hypothetical protein E6Q88_06080 [Xanthomonadaceae bacterium]